MSPGACAPVLFVDATGIVKKKPEKLGKKKSWELLEYRDKLC